MILVTVGTNEAPFDRLLRAFDRLPAEEEVLVQHGPSSVRPPGATCVDFLGYHDLAAAIRRSRAVVTHAGVGSIMTALANGKRPVVVPRLHRFREAVDDHQIQLGTRLHEAGLVTFVERPEDVLAALAAPAHGVRQVDLAPDRRLVAELREFIKCPRRR